MLMGILNILRHPEGKKPLNLNLEYPKLIGPQCPLFPL